MTLSGTERAALRLTLGLLRAGTYYLVDVPVTRALHRAAAQATRMGAPRRAVLARLALYIRSVLRADSLGWDWIDLGGCVFADEEMSGADLGECRYNEGLGPSWRFGQAWENARAAVPYRIARPLWLDARGVER